MKKNILLSIAFIGFSFYPTCFINAQGVGINSAGNSADPSAIIDVSSNLKGALLPRMTTAERDAISSPAQSLIIFNTTTNCFEFFLGSFWQTISCGCTGAPSAVTASASSSTLCEGSALTLTGAATGATGWSWTGPNGFTSALQSPAILNITTAASGVYTLTASNACGAATAVSTASVTVNAPPTTANAGSDINPACNISAVTLAANTPSVGTGNWSVVSGTATITTPGSPASGVTGLAVPGIATLRWTISNSPCAVSTDDVIITTCWGCGASLTINHIMGAVAPETKTVNYGTVTSSLSGASKCWITQNLGSTNQAISEIDDTEASAGWYWQFNLKQGYKHDGTTRTPNTAWISSITENSDWLTANDPCTIELGAGWRIPTYTEWSTVTSSSGWGNAAAAYGSVLKLHAAGDLNGSNGNLLFRGTYGLFWSSKQYDSSFGWDKGIGPSHSDMYNGFYKTYGFSIRCIKD